MRAPPRRLDIFVSLTICFCIGVFAWGCVASFDKATHIKRHEPFLTTVLFAPAARMFDVAHLLTGNWEPSAEKTKAWVATTSLIFWGVWIAAVRFLSALHEIHARNQR